MSTNSTIIIWCTCIGYLSSRHEHAAHDEYLCRVYARNITNNPEHFARICCETGSLILTDYDRQWWNDINLWKPNVNSITHGV